jgi:hypothetical protein
MPKSRFGGFFRVSWHADLYLPFQFAFFKVFFFSFFLFQISKSTRTFRKRNNFVVQYLPSRHKAIWTVFGLHPNRWNDFLNEFIPPLLLSPSWKRAGLTILPERGSNTLFFRLLPIYFCSLKRGSRVRYMFFGGGKYQKVKRWSGSNRVGDWVVILRAPKRGGSAIYAHRRVIRKLPRSLQQMWSVASGGLRILPEERKFHRSWFFNDLPTSPSPLLSTASFCGRHTSSTTITTRELSRAPFLFSFTPVFTLLLQRRHGEKGRDRWNIKRYFVGVRWHAESAWLEWLTNPKQLRTPARLVESGHSRSLMHAGDRFLCLSTSVNRKKKSEKKNPTRISK